MAYTFAKVFSQILESSLAEDWQTRLVFEDFLKLADGKGVVDMTVEAIARRTNVPLEIVKRGIAALEQPDPASRTPDEEGRRIVRLDDHRDWGWKVVNIARYRESANKEMLRMGEAQRKAAYRKRNGFPSPLPKEKEDKDLDRDLEQSRPSPKMSQNVRDIGGTSTECIMPSRPKDLAEVLAVCQKECITDDMGRDCFDYYESSGWIDKNGNAVRDWQACLRTWKSRAVNRAAERAHHGKAAQSKTKPNHAKGW